jgi:hypothetical protein
MTRSESNSTISVVRSQRGFGFYVISTCLVAVVVTLCDYFCHTRMNVLYYHHPNRGISFFHGHPTQEVFLNFLAMSAALVFVGSILFKDFPDHDMDLFLWNFLVFIGFYYCTGLFSDYPMTLHSVFLAVWSLNIHAFRGDIPRIAAFCVLLGILGPVIEGYFSENGFFAYFFPHIYNVPVWLSSLYLQGGLAIVSGITLPI